MVSSWRCEVRPELGALSVPAPLAWGRQPGPVARVSLTRGVWVWDPRTVRSWKLALRAVGWQEGSPSRDASCLCEGCLWLGAEPQPSRLSWGQAAGLHCPRAVGAGVQA